MSAAETETTRDGWTLEGADKRAYVGAMFDSIASPYDRLNRLISLGRDRAWRRSAVRLANLEAGGTLVDLGTGTGDLALDFLKVHDGKLSVIGVDIARGMLSVAAGKTAPEVRYDLVRASAERTGLESGIADAVSMAWVLRNVGDRSATYAEILRLLKPGGTFVCLEMSHPESWFSRAGYAAYRHGVMPVLARIAGGEPSAYRYLAGSSAAFPGRQALAEEITAAGFESVGVKPLMMGSLAIHHGRKPS